MHSLQSQINWCRRTQFALLVGVSAFVVLFYITGYRPRALYEAHLDAEIAGAQSQLAVVRAQSKRLPEMSADLLRLRSQLSGFPAMPPVSDVGEFLGQLTDLSKQSGVHKLEVNFAPAIRQSDQLTQLPLALKFQGDFQSAFDFLRRLEEMHRLTRLEGLSIHALDATSGNVQVSLSMEMFFSGGTNVAQSE
jgi:hypothetical protein